MEIALVVLNYNDYKTTCNYLENIKDYKSIDKIIVVDNKSTNNSYEILKKHRSEKIDVISTEYNGGYAYGNNFGVKYAIEKYDPKAIIISNPDVIFQNEIIYYMEKILRSDEKIAIVVPNIINSDGTKFNAAWKLPTWRDDLISNLDVLSKLVGNPCRYNESELSKAINYVDVVSGCFFMIDTKALIDVDYFDEETFLFCEERILAFKLKMKGYKSVLATEISCIHDHSKTINKSFSSYLSKYRLLVKSRRVYHSKYLKVNKVESALLKISEYLGTAEKYMIPLLKSLIKKSPRS